MLALLLPMSVRAQLSHKPVLSLAIAKAAEAAEAEAARRKR